MDIYTSPNEMEKFFHNPRQSLGREAILMHKLVHDLQFAAAKNNYYLRAYSVDVDNDGYDLILDCGLYLRKFQVKTVLKSAKTRHWDLQAGVLKPTIEDASNLSI